MLKERKGVRAMDEFGDLIRFKKFRERHCSARFCERSEHFDCFVLSYLRQRNLLLQCRKVNSHGTASRLLFLKDAWLFLVCSWMRIRSQGNQTIFKQSYNSLKHLKKQNNDVWKRLLVLRSTKELTGTCEIGKNLTFNNHPSFASFPPHRQKVWQLLVS